MWSIFRRRKALPVPRLVVAGHDFAAGGRISGHAVVGHAVVGHAVVGPEPGDALIVLRRVTAFREHFTSLSDHPIASCPLGAGLGHVEQTFVIDIPSVLPPPSAVFVEDGEPWHAWEVSLVVNRVVCASHRVAIG